MASRRMEDCVSPLAAAWEALSHAFHKEYEGWKAVVVCTYRPPEEQLELFKRGRRKRPDGVWVVDKQEDVITYKDGTKLRSRHNDFPARALDIEVYDPSGRKYWDTVSSVEKGTLINPWLWLMDAAPRYGLENGGAWTSFKDYPHFQLA